MRKFLKNLWLGSIEAMKSIMSLISMLLFSSRGVAKNIAELAKDVDVHKNAFVLGNGPSLISVLNTQKLRNEIKEGVAIVTNRFAVSPDFYELKPQYYILMDPKFFDESFIMEDPSVKEMYNALNKVDWPLILFLSKESNLTVVKKYLKNKFVKVVMFNGTTVTGPAKFQNKIFKMNLGLPSSRNIIIPAIMLMINLGYKQVFLYGAEFSWTKNIDINPVNNRVFLNNGHFYKEEDIVYNEKGWYKWYLSAIVEMLTGTEKLERYASSRGTKIINRTQGSFIDAFEYENPEYIGL